MIFDHFGSQKGHFRFKKGVFKFMSHMTAVREQNTGPKWMSAEFLVQFFSAIKIEIFVQLFLTILDPKKSILGSK